MAQNVPKTTEQIEQRLGNWARGHLPPYVRGVVVFILKQGWAALFGGVFLAALIITRLIWQDDWLLSRNDALVMIAVCVQALMLAFHLETWDEAKVIFLFHVTGTVMEVYKLHVGSWDYPGSGMAEVFGVPLFTGFMYAAVGSYIARVIRGFRMQFAPYPPFWVTLILAGAIYANFFTHHFWVDIRLGLFVATVVIYARTRLWFDTGIRARWIPLPLAIFFAAILIWIAENVGTFTQTWVYAGQGTFDLVSLGKLGSWYLLLYVSFTTVTLVGRDALHRDALSPSKIKRVKSY